MGSDSALTLRGLCCWWCSGGSGDAQGSSTTFTYHGMRNFGNLCAITYLQDCAPDQGATSVIPRSHRQLDGREGPIRRPLFTEGSTEGVWNGLYRTVEGIDEVEARAVTPTVSAGDVLICECCNSSLSLASSSFC